jgi:hypothetical protein
MRLSRKLFDTLMTFECPYCGHTTSKKGGWFKAKVSLQCQGCRNETPLSYDAKIQLFAKYTGGELEPTPKADFLSF